MAHEDDNSSSSSLFIDTNLDTHLVIIVSHSDTVSDLKRKIMLEHHQWFPAIGDIKIDSLKVKLRGHFYHLPDSMFVKSAFATVKDNWFLSVDASRLAQGVCIQQVDNYKVGDQLALPCATDNRSVDQGSPSTHLTIVPVVNHVVSSVNQFTTGNSDKDYLKNTEEDRPFVNAINSKKGTLVQSESLVEDSSGSGPSVEKKHKTEEIEASVKASEDLGGENIRTNNENSMENNIQDVNDESTRLNKGEKCSGIDRKPENKNEKMDGEKRNKRKKKTKKSAKNGEGSMSTEVSDPHLNDHLNENAKEHETTLLDAARKDGDEVKGRETQVFDVGLLTKAKKNKKSSVTGPEDLPSKCQSSELELEPEKSQSTDHQTSNNMTVSEVVKSKDIVNDAPRISKSAHANKTHGEPSAEVFLNQKNNKPRVTLGLASVKTVQKSAPEVNKSQHVKSLLSGSGTMHGGDSDESSAEDKASPGRSSSSSGDIDSSIDSRKKGYCVVKRKGGGGNSQSKSKNISMTDRLRSSPRFKRVKVTASQQLGDTESESSESVGSVDFVPESPPMAEILLHLYRQHLLSSNDSTQFSRYLEQNYLASQVFLRMKGDKKRIKFIRGLDLTPYKYNPNGGAYPNQ